MKMEYSLEKNRREDNNGKSEYFKRPTTWSYHDAHETWFNLFTESIAGQSRGLDA
jgi:hypothetical protein